MSTTVKEKLEAASTRVNVKKLIKNELHPDTIGTKKGGNILCRWGYFYRNGTTAGNYVEKIEKLLRANNISFCIANYGDHWAAFRGGASTANQSHFYVEIKIF